MPTRTVGRYRLIKQLGVGMFSKVMLGVDEETGLEYAVKVMRKDSLEEMDMARYARREAAVLRKLSHRNIVSFIEAIQSDTKLFLVMEVVDGCELLDIVKRGGALGEVDARCYIQQLVDAVSYLHSKGVVHRDLKPDNVLVDVDRKCLKIIDFGLTGVIRKNHVMKTCCGSTYYSAPEVTYRSSFVSHGPTPTHMGNGDTASMNSGGRSGGRGGRGEMGGRQIVVDGYDGIKADAWSLGILAYILLTGCHPFVDADGELMTVMLRQGVVEYPDYLSRGAVHFMSRLLSIDPRKRYSVAQVSLHPWLTGKPVTSTYFSTATTTSSINNNGGSGSIGGGCGSTGSLASSPAMVMNTSSSASNVMQRDRPRKDTEETFTFGAFRSSGSSKRPNTFNGVTHSHQLHHQQDEQNQRYHQREQERQEEEEEKFQNGQQQQQQSSSSYRTFFGRALSDRLHQSSSSLAVRRRSSNKHSSGSFLWFRRQHHSQQQQQHATNNTTTTNINTSAIISDDATDLDTSTTECAPLSSSPPISTTTTQISAPAATVTNGGNMGCANDQLPSRRGSLDRPRPVREGRITLDFINARAHHDSMDVNPRVRRQLSLSNRTRALLMRNLHTSNNNVSPGTGGGAGSGATTFPTATIVDS